ncbi:2OG-Fe(II) oxygenase [Sphingosinicella sp. LHD-64]|uniref:2OG-Fe(II) oxygenase n=1 Tax=Sphingosinicella sp. LHD-64 TaxID=3072139 RepID=UPI00280F12CB|nr:2OG-Fe(II) oxygenase [Sphingosinicella sp. LHD-64]MDQ8754705.1 2OG-Fe(II) oxygenase [Sphingosinicella sp. LHD-64]
MQRLPASAEAAERLAASGRRPEAVLMMNQLAAAGDPDALFALGLWRLAGRIVPPDVMQARDLFRRAGEAGRRDGARVHVNFLASGTGGPADWPAALKRLGALARHDPASRTALALIETMDLDAAGGSGATPTGGVVHETPEVRHFERFFTPGECDYLTAVAAPRMKPSVVVDEHTGRQVPNPIRTSDGADFPWLLADPAVTALGRRIAAASGTGFDQGEPLQVLRYRSGQQYRPHLDAIAGLDNQRILTMIVYLTDGYRGGETRFTRSGFTFRGRKGDALLFRNTLPDGRPDPASEHAGLPVTAGTKLIASRWIRARTLVPE